MTKAKTVKAKTVKAKTEEEVLESPEVAAREKEDKADKKFKLLLVELQGMKTLNTPRAAKIVTALFEGLI